MNTKMFCWLKNVWDIWWIEFKVEIKISLSCFNNKIYILSNGYDGLAVGY